MRFTDQVSWRWTLALVGLVFAAGCGQSPQPADPDAATKALKAALDAWKSGQSRDAFARAASIQTADSRWDGGYQLLDYDIGQPERHGYDVNFAVKLKLADRQGKKLSEKATYAVGTAPKPVVLRLEGM